MNKNILTEIQFINSQFAKKVEDYVQALEAEFLEREKAFDDKIKLLSALEEKEKALEERERQLEQERNILRKEKEANNDKKVSLDALEKKLNEKMRKVQNILSD